MSLNINRYEDDPFFVENADRLNKSLLKKMLAQGFLESLSTSSEKTNYQFTQDADVLLLPGAWDTNEFSSKEGILMRNINRKIGGVKVDDKIFVLAASSFITNLELVGEKLNITDTNEKDAVMKNDAISIINNSSTSVNVRRGSDVWSLTKEHDKPGEFKRLDINAEDYDLDADVWKDLEKGRSGGRIRGAYSSLFCIIGFPEPGQYRLQILNDSDLYNSPGKRFDLEVNYHISVI
ncbi:MAG: hypothetical protein AB7V56_04480 [Candidatus Nitrosocosmicus sp.]|jgi:hypothetical protein